MAFYAFFSLCTESAVAKITYTSHLVALDFYKLAWGGEGIFFFSTRSDIVHILFSMIRLSLE